MKSDKLIFSSSTSILKYFIPSFMFFGTIAAYIFSFNEIIVGVLAFFTVISAFTDTLTIYIYQDRCEFFHHNIFANFLSIRNTYYFSEIKEFEYSIDSWQANFKESLLIISINLMLPARHSSISNSPEANVSITEIDKLGELKSHNFKFKISDSTEKEALEIIKQICDKNTV